MGVNNKQRRAAKQKQRARQRARSSPPPSDGASGVGAGSFDPGMFDPGGQDPGLDEPHEDSARDMYAQVGQHVHMALRLLMGQKVDRVELGWRAEVLLRLVGPGSRELVGEVLGAVLVSSVDAMVAGGWDPGDLAELVRRRDESWLPVLAGALREQSRTKGRADAQWLASIDAIAPQGRLLLSRVEDIALALGLSSLVGCAPLLDEKQVAASARARTEPVEHPKWHQARSLLAKAESTDFGPEAEALVAKAQELISRYALERLIDSYRGGQGARQSQPVPRRVWLDRPYVRPKGILVAEVARANHCRAALAEDHGFVLLVGHESDLGAVELLVTSLLAQADVAMLRCGRGAGSGGARARSRGFRQSFLTAFAYRIGERLQAAHESAVSTHVNALPVLRDHEARVSEAFDAMVPHTTGQAVNVSDYAGWDAGSIAADHALLDVNARLSADSDTG